MVCTPDVACPVISWKWRIEDKATDLLSARIANVTIHNGAYEWNINSTIPPQDGYCMYLKNERTGQNVNDMNPFQISAFGGGRRKVALNTTSSAASLSPSDSSTVTPNAQPSSSTPTTKIPSSQSDPITSDNATTRSATMTSLWSSSYSSLLYSSALVTSPSPAPTPQTQSPSPEPASTPSTQYKIALALGSIACIVIGLNVGWFVVSYRRRRRKKLDKEGTKDAPAPKDRSSSSRRSKPDHRAAAGASYSKPQLEDTGILELEAALAPAVAAAEPGACYELEAHEKPLELRASVATWLSRRTGGRPRSRGPHASMN